MQAFSLVVMVVKSYMIRNTPNHNKIISTRSLLCLRRDILSTPVCSSPSSDRLIQVATTESLMWIQDRFSLPEYCTHKQVFVVWLPQAIRKLNHRNNIQPNTNTTTVRGGS